MKHKPLTTGHTSSRLSCMNEATNSPQELNKSLTRSTLYFFLLFFFFVPFPATPPAPVDAAFWGVPERLGPSSTCMFASPDLLAAVKFADDGALIGAGAARGGVIFGGRRFVIFCMRDRFRASNRLRKIDEWVLYFKHVVSSVIFNTSLPSDGFHLTQYRALFGDFEYNASACRWYSCHEDM